MAGRGEGGIGKETTRADTKSGRRSSALGWEEPNKENFSGLKIRRLIDCWPKVVEKGVIRTKSHFIHWVFVLAA
jgi:hypothetical protein